MGKTTAIKPSGKAKKVFGTTKGAFGKEGGKGGKRKTGGKPLAKGVSCRLERIRNTRTRFFPLRILPEHLFQSRRVCSCVLFLSLTDTYDLDSALDGAGLWAGKDETGWRGCVRRQDSQVSVPRYIDKLIL